MESVDCRVFKMKTLYRGAHGGGAQWPTRSALPRCAVGPFRYKPRKQAGGPHCRGTLLCSADSPYLPRSNCWFTGSKAARHSSVGRPNCVADNIHASVAVLRCRATSDETCRGEANRRKPNEIVDYRRTVSYKLLRLGRSLSFKSPFLIIYTAAIPIAL